MRKRRFNERNGHQLCHCSRCPSFHGKIDLQTLQALVSSDRNRHNVKCVPVTGFVQDLETGQFLASFNQLPTTFCLSFHVFIVQGELSPQTVIPAEVSELLADLSHLPLKDLVKVSEVSKEFKDL